MAYLKAENIGQLEQELDGLHYYVIKAEGRPLDESYIKVDNNSGGYPTYTRFVYADRWGDLKKAQDYAEMFNKGSRPANMVVKKVFSSFEDVE